MRSIWPANRGFCALGLEGRHPRSDLRLGKTTPISVAKLDLPRFRGEMRSWDQGIWVDGILSSSLGRSFGSAESIFSSRPAGFQGCRVERLSRMAGGLSVQPAVTFPGRSLTGASTTASSDAPGSSVGSANWPSNLMGDRYPSDECRRRGL